MEPERTPRDESELPLETARGTRPPPAAELWARVLAGILEAPEPLWTPGPVPRQALAVFWEDAEGAVTGLYLARTTAAALVTRVLRNRSLSAQSTPAEVREAVARFLGAYAERTGAVRAVRVREEPRDAAWGPAWGFTIVSPTEGELYAVARLATAAQMTAPATGMPATRTLEPTATPDALRGAASGTTDAALDALRLEAPVVVAVNDAPEGGLPDLVPGDLWFPDDGWLALPPASAPGLSPDGFAAGTDDESPPGTTLPRRAILCFPGSARAPLVEWDGPRLRWTGQLWQEAAPDLARPALPGEANGAERVWVCAGSLCLSLTQWRAWPTSGDTEWQCSQRWSLWVGATLRAWGVPRCLDGRWALELTEVVSR